MLKQFAATFLEERSFDAAEDVLQTLTDIDPADPDLHFQLGALVATHSPKEALPHFRSALERSPQGHPWAEEFIQTIEDASETDSAAYTFAQVGQVFITVQMWEHAVLAFEEAVELQPEYVDALAFLGIALDHIGKDGLAELHRAAGLDPTHPIPHLYLGIHWSKRGELHRALAELERAARLDPQNPTVAIQIGEVYRKLGEQATAIDAYRIATEIAPGEAQYWLLLAQVSLMEEFQVNEIALPAARNALILEPDNPAAVDALGYGYFLLGDLKFAERFLLRAVQLDPSRVQSQYHLGLLMAALERSEPARAAFQMAISLDPDGNVGELARRAMENILK
jgi:tetratricopeptide (TPR) repeat protein